VRAGVRSRPEPRLAASSHCRRGQFRRFEDGRPLFTPSVSRRVSFSGTPSPASLVKLCGNFMILAAIEALGEAMTLAAKGGIAKKTAAEILTGTLFDSPVYRTTVHLAEGRFKPAGLPLRSASRTMRLVGIRGSAALPMRCSESRDHLLQTIAQQGEMSTGPQSGTPSPGMLELIWLRLQLPPASTVPSTTAVRDRIGLTVDDGCRHIALA